MFEYLINLPTKVLFGFDKLALLGEEAKKLGSKALLMYDPFLSNSPVLNTVQGLLLENGLEVVCFDDVSPNPRHSVIDAAVQLCNFENCDLVIAVGGGSAIDSAKAVAIVAENGGNTWDYTERENEYVARPTKGKLPIITIPTTAGTGTEVTPYAVINNTDIHFKATIISEICFPTVSIVDPSLMLTMPPHLTALTGIDAFAHAFESYINKNSTTFSSMVSLEAIRLFAQSIETCVNNPTDRHARENMALASTLGGLAIAHSSTTLPHAIGQPLSGLTDAPHGGSIAVCIQQIIRWTLPQGKEKFAKVAETMKPSIRNLSVDEKANLLPSIIDELFGRILHGKKETMSGYGLKDDEIDRLADTVLSCYIMDCKGHPKMPDRKDIVNIIRESM